MSWFDNIANVFKSIQKPIDVVCDLIAEPLETRRHERSEKAKDSDIRREKERDSSRIKAESEARIREKEADSQREIDIKRSIAEIDAWKKDKDFQRMKQTAEAVTAYQERLTKLNVSAINAIGNMQLELRERAQELVYNKTVQYKELQDLATKEAIEDLIRIESVFSDNERAKEILMNAVDKKLSNIIETARRFLEELSDDIKTLNKSINILTEQGQISIDNHLNRFALLPNENLILHSNHEKLKDAEPRD